MRSPRLAEAIIDGLERWKPEVVPGWPAKGYAWLAHWMPKPLERWAATRWRTDDLTAGQTGDGHAR